MTARRRLYEEKLVREIMISTALCVEELLMDDPDAGEDAICDFVERNYQSIIKETIAAELESEASSDDPPESDFLEPPMPEDDF